MRIASLLAVLLLAAPSWASPATLSGGGPEIDVMPSTVVDFGQVQVGTSAQRTVTIANEGDAPLEISSVSISGDATSIFSIVSGGGAGTIAAGGSRSVVVEYTPQGVFSNSRQLVIESNDADESTVSVRLVGFGTTQPQGAPEINVTPSTVVDFGQVEVGMSEQRTVTIDNEGSAPLEISSISISGDATSIFSIVSGGGAGTIAAGGSRSVVVEYTPQGMFSNSRQLVIESNDADESTVSVRLSGFGTGGPQTGPEIAVTPSTVVDFGQVEIGMSEQRTVTIDNEGDAPLQISSISISGDPGSTFQIVSGGGAGTIAAGGSRSVVVEYTPLGVFSNSRQLVIESNDADEGTVSVRLAGFGLPRCGYTFSAIATSSLMVPSSGGQLEFAFEINNRRMNSVMVDVWAKVENSAGDVLVIRNPRTPTVAANSVYSAGYNQRVPSSLADGTYTFTLMAGDYDADPSMADICGMQSFTFTKGAAPLAGKAATAGELRASDWAAGEIVNETVSAMAPESDLSLAPNEVRVGPNPTQGQATFSFTTTADADVALSIYDVRGREVASVVEGRMEAGSHTARLSQELPAGVYVWRFVAGTRVETGRLTVVR